jgi:hypothetical protein
MKNRQCNSWCKRWVDGSAPPHERPTACSVASLDSLRPLVPSCTSSHDAYANRCRRSPLASSTYGPFLVWHSGDSLEANVGGCMALVDGDLSATGCGATYAAWQDCYVAACDTCPGGTFTSCANQAQIGVCGAYQAAAMSCYNQSKYGACKPTSFETYFTSYGALFCAVGSSDASTD